MDAVRDCAEIWSRLFDHRHFLNGELKYMLREFEEKRSDREIENLFSAIQNTIEIKDSQINRLRDFVSTDVPALTSKVDEAIKESELILDLENNSKTDTTLEEKREARKKAWLAFIDDVSEKYTRIDNAFEQKEEELKDLYADLEHKLVITTQ